MKSYLVIRHGSNAANQSRCPKVVLGWIKASTRTEAHATARDKWTCHNNQRFEIKTHSQATQAERDEASFADAYEAAPEVIY